MTAPLTIVKYHYVRDLERSRYPEIKGLSTRQFRTQMEYIRKHYAVISGSDLLQAVSGGAPLPARALLLTFDDGYSDHFTQAFPILDDLQLPGCFFPPARPILEDCVLDVNKIHFILAAVPDKPALVERVFGLLDVHRQRFGLPANDAYWQRFAQPGRYDPPEVMFLKRLLQRGLPDDLRQIILDDLFRSYVSGDEAAFAQELYMTVDQLRCLQRHGMTLGSHGYNHAWLDSLTPEAQAEEVDRSLEFLSSLGVQTGQWIISYPYGAYDASLLAILAERGCVAGVTTEIGLAEPGHHDPLTLPRLDTNDLPQDAVETLSPWTQLVAA